MSEKIKKRSSSLAKSVAIGKISKIESAHQAMMISIGIAAFVVGVTSALSIWFVKNIIFNASVIDAKDETISELKSEQSALKDISTYVLSDLANDERLNIVARSRSSECSALDNGKTGSDSIITSLDNLNLARTCTGLRVISDALPISQNEDATKSDLHQLLIWNGTEVESLNTSDNGEVTIGESTNLYYDSLSLQIENASTSSIRSSIKKIQSSIRNFEFTRASFEYANDGSLDFNSTLTSYYTEDSDLEGFAAIRYVCYDKTSEKCGSNTSGSE